MSGVYRTWLEFARRTCKRQPEYFSFSLNLFLVKTPHPFRNFNLLGYLDRINKGVYTNNTLMPQTLKSLSQ